MTYDRLRSLVNALLIGDNAFTKKEDEQLALLAYAFDKISTEADALKLFTASKDAAILRQGPGRLFVRKPDLPKDGTDVLDIDDELGYPIARYIASFVSKDNKRLHVLEAEVLIRAYNSKVDAYLTSLAASGAV